MSNKNKNEGSIATKESDEIKDNTPSDTNAQLMCEAVHVQGESEVTLYHASTKNYNPGDVICGRVRQISENKAEVEAVFERYRGDRPVSRRSALFAFSDEAHCVKYLVTQLDYDDTPIHLYRVEMEAASGPYPMALIDEVRRRMEENCSDEVLKRIVEEYWRPTSANQWRFCEYLGDNMKVVKELSIPTNPEKRMMMLLRAGSQYGKDCDLADTL